MGAMSLAVTVGSATAGTASLIMNIALLVSVVVSGEVYCWRRVTMVLGEWERPGGAPGRPAAVTASFLGGAAGH